MQLVRNQVDINRDTDVREALATDRSLPWQEACARVSESVAAAAAPAATAAVAPSAAAAAGAEAGAGARASAAAAAAVGVAVGVSVTAADSSISSKTVGDGNRDKRKQLLSVVGRVLDYPVHRGRGIGPYDKSFWCR